MFRAPWAITCQFMRAANACKEKNTFHGSKGKGCGEIPDYMKGEFFTGWADDVIPQLQTMLDKEKCKVKFVLEEPGGPCYIDDSLVPKLAEFFGANFKFILSWKNRNTPSPMPSTQVAPPF